MQIRVPMDAQAHARLFSQQIAPLSGIPTATAQAQPRAVILVVQPGGGVLPLLQAARRELGNDAVHIDMGELRHHHPQAGLMRRQQPQAWEEWTEPDAHRWAIDLLTAAVDLRRNVIFDACVHDVSTRSEDFLTHLVQGLEGQGYAVQVFASDVTLPESEQDLRDRLADWWDAEAGATVDPALDAAAADTPPLPSSLREVLAGYPQHLSRLTRALARLQHGPSRGTMRLERAAWLLKHRLETFIHEAQQDLQQACDAGDRPRAEAALDQLYVMLRARSSDGGLRTLADLTEPLRATAGPA